MDEKGLLELWNTKRTQTFGAKPFLTFAERDIGQW